MNDVTAIDIDGTRDAIDHLTALGHRVLPTTFEFVTLTIWGTQHRAANGVGVTLHIFKDSKSFAGRTPAEALADAETWLLEHDPVRVENEGWQILGVVRA